MASSKDIRECISNSETKLWLILFFLTLPNSITSQWATSYDDVIKWKRILRYWSFVRGIHRSPMNSPHKGQWRGALFFFVFLTTGVNNIETAVVWDAITIIMTTL